MKNQQEVKKENTKGVRKAIQVLFIVCNILYVFTIFQLVVHIVRYKKIINDIGFFHESNEYLTTVEFDYFKYYFIAAILFTFILGVCVIYNYIKVKRLGGKRLFMLFIIFFLFIMVIVLFAYLISIVNYY